MVITVAEVRAWRAASEPAVREREARPLEMLTVEDVMGADARTSPWWQERRFTHGDPQLS